MKKLFTLCAISLLTLSLGCATGSKKNDMMSESMADKSTITYTVEKGDTLYKISRKFDIDVNDLAAENNLVDKNQIKVGQVLNITK